MRDITERADGVQETPAIRVKRFWTEYKFDRKTGASTPVDWVEWYIKGEQHVSERQEKVSRLMEKTLPSGNNPEEEIYYPAALEWFVVGPAYEAWKKNQSIPTFGTPLDAWPGLTPQQAEIFKRSDILTVDDIAEMNETQLAKVRLPGVREIKDRAKAFLLAKESTSKIEEQLASRDELIEQQAARLAELEARMSAMSGDEPPKRRGRPPRVEQHEGEAA